MLITEDIRTVGEANKLFGSETSLISARPGRGGRCCYPFKFWFTVPEGYYALVQRHGADIDYGNCPTWPAGVHFGPPWVKVSHLVTKQSMILNHPVKGCKTKDNVSVQIDCAVVLRVMGDKDRPGDDPANVRKFVYNVTARGLSQQIIDAQAEAVRTLARSVNHTEVFGLRTVPVDELEGVKDKLLNFPENTAAAADNIEINIPETIGEHENPEEEKDMIGYHDDLDAEEAFQNVEHGATVTDLMKARLNKQFKPQGIEITDVIIQKIELPHDIMMQMSQKTMVISKNSEQKMTHKHDMLSLLQDEEITTKMQLIEEEKTELYEEGQFLTGQEKIALNISKAEGMKELELIKTQSRNDLNMITASARLERQRINDVSVLAADKTRLEAEKKSDFLSTESKAEADIMQEKAKYDCAVLASKGDKLIFNAHGIAAPKIRTINNFLTSKKKIAAQDSLASNKKLVVTGTSGGMAANKMLIADTALADIQKMEQNFLSKKDKADLLSEYAVSTGKALVNLRM